MGLSLSAPQTGDINQQQTLALNSNGAAARRSAVNAGSVVGSRGTRLNTNLFCKNTLHDFRGPHQWRQREFKVGGASLVSRLSACLTEANWWCLNYSRIKSARGWANGGQLVLVCYIRKYVIIWGDIPVDVPQPKYWGMCPRHRRRGWRQWPTRVWSHILPRRFLTLDCSLCVGRQRRETSPSDPSASHRKLLRPVKHILWYKLA